MLHAAAGPLVTASYFRQPGRSVSRPIALRRVQCQAKTTSSRKTTSSKSSDTAKAARSTVSNATSSGSQQSLSSSTKRPVVVQNKSFWVRRVANSPAMLPWLYAHPDVESHQQSILGMIHLHLVLQASALLPAVVCVSCQSRS